MTKTGHNNHFDYPLHTTTKKQLEAIVARPSHGYTFYGARYMYKQRSAEQVACALAQTSHLDHPNILQLLPGTTGSIKIADIKALLEQLALTAFDVRAARVVIIHNAQAMTTDASNALLKVLEEPGEGVVFILVTERLQNLLATVRSRTQLVSFLPPENCEQGSQPRRAEALAGNDDLRDDYELATKLADTFLHGRLSARFAVAQKVADKKCESIFTEILERMLLEEQSLEQSMNMIEKLLAAEEVIARNVSSRLSFENLALELAT